MEEGKSGKNMRVRKSQILCENMGEPSESLFESKHGAYGHQD